MENKYTFKEVKEIFEKRNGERKISKVGGDKKPLYCHLVYKQASYFAEEDDIRYRTYVFRSDEPCFIKELKSKSIIADNVIGVEVGIEIDKYLNPEVELIDYCLIKGSD